MRQQTFLQTLSAALICLAVSQFTFASTSTSPPSWQPDLSSMDGRIQFLLSMDQGHRGKILSAEDLFYRGTTLTGTLEKMQLAQRELGEEAKPLDMPGTVTEDRITYSTTSPVDQKVNAEAIRAVVDLLGRDVERFHQLFGNPLPFTGNLANDFDLIKKKVKGPVSDHLNAYFRLLPFLQEHAREGRESVESLVHNLQNLAAANAEEARMILEEKYTEQFRKATAEEISRLSKEQGHDAVLGKWNNFQKEHLKQGGKIEKAKKIINEKGEAVRVAVLSLEKVPAAVGPFRSTEGGDCSRHSVPFYGMAKDVDVFWVKENEKIKGYALVAKVKVGERTLPYVLSISGAGISEERTRKIIDLVARSNRVSEVVLPDFEANKYVVSADPIRSAMSPEGSTKATVTLPKGFALVSAAKHLHDGNYKSYYAPEHISQAVIAKAETFRDPNATVSTVSVPSRYPEVDRLAVLDQSLLDRAIIAAQLLGPIDPKVLESPGYAQQQEKVLTILKIDRSQLEAAQMLIHMDAERNPHFVSLHPIPLSGERYDKIHGALGLGLDEILTYFTSHLPGPLKDDPAKLEERSLIALFWERPALMPEQQWDARLKAYREEEKKQLIKDLEELKPGKDPPLSIESLEKLYRGGWNNPELLKFESELKGWAGDLIHVTRNPYEFERVEKQREVREALERWKATKIGSEAYHLAIQVLQWRMADLTNTAYNEIRHLESLKKSEPYIDREARLEKVRAEKLALEKCWAEFEKAPNAQLFDEVHMSTGTVRPKSGVLEHLLKQGGKSGRL